MKELTTQPMATQYRKTCKNCQQDFLAHHSRLTYCSDQCKAALAAKAKREKSEYDRQRYQANTDVVKQRVATWKTANRDRVNELSRAAYQDPIKGAKIRARLDRYVEANREVCERRWKENVQRRIEKGEHQALCGKRRRRIEVNTPEMTAAERAKLAQFYRVARLLAKRYGVAFDVDHIVPLSRGGAHHPSNLQILTASANRKKGAKMPAELAA